MDEEHEEGGVGDEVVKVVCSQCNREITVDLSWLRACPEVTCTCDTVIDLRVDDFLGQLRRAEQAFNRKGKRFS